DENWLTSVAVVASNDVWATGVARDPDWGIMDRPFMVHWDGTRWSLVDTPDPGGHSQDTDLSGSGAFASHDVWAVGSVGNEPEWRTFTIHWDGSGWTEAASTTPGRFVAAATDGGAGLWGAGDRSVSQPFSGTVTLGEHLC